MTVLREKTRCRVDGRRRGERWRISARARGKHHIASRKLFVRRIYIYIYISTRFYIELLRHSARRVRRPVVVRRRLEYCYIRARVAASILASFKNKNRNNRCCCRVVFFRRRRRRRRQKKNVRATCANLRGRIDRKCTVICCTCVLSQTTSGCHPVDVAVPPPRLTPSVHPSSRSYYAKFHCASVLFYFLFFCFRFSAMAPRMPRGGGYRGLREVICGSRARLVPRESLSLSLYIYIFMFIIYYFEKKIQKRLLPSSRIDHYTVYNNICIFFHVFLGRHDNEGHDRLNGSVRRLRAWLL